MDSISINKKLNNCSRIKRPINISKCSLNKSCTRFRIPMGSVGPLVSSVPVVLSEFETSIFCDLKYSRPITSVNSICTNVIVCTCKVLSCNRKVFISGFIEKKLRMHTQSCPTPIIKIVKFPFQSIVNLNFLKCPRMNTRYKSICHDHCGSYLVSANPICCHHEYTKFSESQKFICAQDNCSCKKVHVIRMKVSLGITIVQRQKVFIPDSCECAHVIDKCVGFNSDCVSHVEAGPDCKCNIVARVCDC